MEQNDFAENYWLWVTKSKFYLDRVLIKKGHNNMIIEDEQTLKSKIRPGRRIRGRRLSGKPKIRYVEREGLEPYNDFTDSWWTCHKETKEGDLVLVYRAGKHGKHKYMDIKYLFRATTNALCGYDVIENFDEIKEPRWDYICYFESLYKFKKSIKYHEMHTGSLYHNLRNWGALRANFHRKAYRIPDHEFGHLINTLSEKNHEFLQFKDDFGPLKGF